MIVRGHIPEIRKYGNSPGGGGNFDDSSFLISGLTDGDTILFRFVAAMFTNVCPTPLNLVENPLWDVNRFEIKGAVEVPCVPEPGALALAGTGLIAGLGWYARRRRG